MCYWYAVDYTLRLRKKVVSNFDTTFFLRQCTFQKKKICYLLLMCVRGCRPALSNISQDVSHFGDLPPDGRPTLSPSLFYVGEYKTVTVELIADFM